MNRQVETWSRLKVAGNMQGLIEPIWRVPVDTLVEAKVWGSQR